MTEEAPLPSCVAIVLHHSGEAQLRRTIESLVYQPVLTAVCVIDNGSTDASIAAVLRDHAGVEVVRNEENLDFGSAYNRAIPGRTEDVIFIANDDIVVFDGSIENALRHMVDHPDVASVSFHSVPPDAPNGGFPTSCPPLRRFGKELSPARHFNARSDPAITSPCFLSGAACCIWRDVFLRTRFCELLDWYFEDVELGWSIRRLTGRRNVFLPSALAYHEEHGTARSRFSTSDVERRTARNAMICFARNGSFIDLVIAMPYFVYNLARVPRRLKLMGALGRLFANRLSLVAKGSSTP